jgi:predicted nucleotidyltransferase
MAEAVLQAPSDAEVDDALARFAVAVAAHYAGRLKGLYLFGSRVRADHRPDSDADVAVVLADDGWQYWDEKMRLVDLAFDHTRASGVYVQPWPFTETEWANGGASDLVRNARREACARLVAADGES